MRARIQHNSNRGGGVELLLEGGSCQFFFYETNDNLWFSKGGPCPLPPSASAHIRVSNSLNSHLFIYFISKDIFARPGQFTDRLLIISAVVKGKDSMILFKIKETAHSNSGHVLF